MLKNVISTVVTANLDKDLVVMEMIKTRANSINVHWQVQQRIVLDKNLHEEPKSAVTVREHCIKIRVLY